MISSNTLRAFTQNDMYAQNSHTRTMRIPFLNTRVYIVMYAFTKPSARSFCHAHSHSWSLTAIHFERNAAVCSPGVYVLCRVIKIGTKTILRYGRKR